MQAQEMAKELWEILEREGVRSVVAVRFAPVVILYRPEETEKERVEDLSKKFRFRVEVVE